MIIAMNLSALTKQLAHNCVLESIDNQHCILLIDPNYAVSGSKAKENLQTALQSYMQNSGLKLLIKAQKSSHITPAVQQQQQRDDRQQIAVDALNNDSNVIALKEHFNARVIVDTIELL